MTVYRLPPAERRTFTAVGIENGTDTPRVTFTWVITPEIGAVKDGELTGDSSVVNVKSPGAPVLAAHVSPNSVAAMTGAAPPRARAKAATVAVVNALSLTVLLQVRLGRFHARLARDVRRAQEAVSA
jgi:hypothetical protein